jgi:hypothetical protein
MSTGGTDFIVPRYDLLISPTTYSLGALAQNPIEAGPQNFSLLRGLQEVTLTDSTTNFSASFYVNGGYSNYSGGYYQVPLANYHYITRTATNCGITFLAGSPPPPNIFNVNTTIADSGGRVYQISYSPNGASPTIQKLSGTAILGDFVVSVKVVQIERGQFIG